MPSSREQCDVCAALKDVADPAGMYLLGIIREGLRAVGIKTAHNLCVEHLALLTSIKDKFLGQMLAKIGKVGKS